MKIVTPYNYKYSFHRCISFDSDVDVLEVDTSVSSNSNSSPVNGDQYTNSDHKSAIFTDLMTMEISPSKISQVVSSDYNSADSVSNPIVES